MKLIIGSDHAAPDLREELAQWRQECGDDVTTTGAATSESFDYPDVSDAVAAAVLAGEADLGVLICGTGIGVSIRANRYRGIRAAVCTSEEMAQLARQHNHANVLCLGARILSPEQCRAILNAFLATHESGEDRHQRRVKKLDREPATGSLDV